MLTPNTFLVCVLVVLGGCHGFERPEVFVTNITPMESTLFEQRVQVDLRFLNPNDRALPVRGLDFKLDVNNIRLARGVAGEDFVIPPFGEAETSVLASTTLLDLALQLASLANERELTYQLRGRVHLGGGLGGTVPFEQIDTLVTLPDFTGGLGTDLGPAVQEVP